MIRKIYRELMPHVPGSVSPMIACGRTIKQPHPDAVTVFIGPCIAKKSEAREKDLAGAIDYVLTFQEVRDIFEATKSIRSRCGRAIRIIRRVRAGYMLVRAGSEAVRETVERLSPAREITPRTQHADGVPACKAMINDLLAGKTTANFFEGMGCVGGCVGGPKAVIDREQGRKNVDEYGRAATYPTPIDNPYVIELFTQAGF